MKKYLKSLMIVVFAALIVGASFAATYAWLTAKTDTIVNTFTAGNISITLTETKGTEFKMVPGAEIEKNPKVTVIKDSETCWVFVKVEKSANFDTFITATIADGWSELETGVYYREVTLSNNDQVFSVLKGDKVIAKTEPTKTDYNALGDSKPTLTFTAYAVQKAGFDTAAAAWAEAKKLDQTTPQT